MSTQSADDRATGWLMFSAIVLFGVGTLRLISAISYFADSHKVNDLTLGLFGGNLWAWGLWDLIIAGLALVAGYSLLTNGTFGRVAGYAWGVVVIVQSFLIIAYAPWFAAAAIALGTLVIYGLAVASADEAA